MKKFIYPSCTNPLPAHGLSYHTEVGVTCSTQTQFLNRFFRSVRRTGGTCVRPTTKSSRGSSHDDQNPNTNDFPPVPRMGRAPPETRLHGPEHPSKRQMAVSPWPSVRAENSRDRRWRDYYALASELRAGARIIPCILCTVALDAELTPIPRARSGLHIENLGFSRA
jgi:hypothetical protein